MSRRRIKDIHSSPDQDMNNQIRNYIRNNIRNANYSRVAELVLEAFRNDKLDKETIYSDVIKKYVEGNEPVPKQYEAIFLKYARYFQGLGEKEKTLKILNKIENSENPKIRKKVRRLKDLMTLTQELLKGTDRIDSDTINQIADALESENDSDKRTYIEILNSLFGKEFSIDQLELGEIEKYLRNHKKPRNTNTDHFDRKYDKELQVENRIKFFKDELELDQSIRFCEEGIFAGSILLYIKDSDLVIVEKIFDIYEDGTYKYNNYGSSTYIMPKDKVLELIKLATRKNVKEQLSIEEQWPPIQHRNNENYKWKEIVKSTISKGKRVDINTTSDTKKTNSERVKFKYTIASQTQANYKSNREFLHDINNSLGNILSEDIIEQLVKRTSSYSFQKVYDGRLKEKIFQNLEYLEVPEEKKDVEAKKMFLVMRMTMDCMSSLRNKDGSKGGVSEEELSKILEKYSVKYEEAIEILKNGVENGQNYKEISNAMKACTEIKNVEKKENNQNDNVALSESNQDSENVPSDISQASQQQEENTDEERDTKSVSEGLDRLLDDMIKNNNGNHLVLNVAKKIQELLTRIEELDRQQQQMDIELQAIIVEEMKARENAINRLKEQKLAQEKLQQAIKEEEEATKLAEQAVSAVQAATAIKQDVEGRQETIRQEQDEINNKLKEFLEL